MTDVAMAAVAGPAESLGKRIVDIGLALGLLVFLAPLMIVTALAVKTTSPGPILFRQQRAGLHGQTFRILKFRTMTVTEDGDTIRQATRGDQRVTPVGALLRRASIDELPQLINVLRGEMSLVGPRPHALAHDRYYGALISDYAARYRTKPGLTGLAQVMGARGETQTTEDMRRRIEFDNRYIDEWRLLGDLKILVLTAVLVPFQKAY
ncbi:sugar transferase [Caulobacter endophyticus]|uniref:Exopolysaccharide biosynthesis protein n=1 Tax=Caulobacter endophyticus TaxID=2172652 RepID=A0A2T9JXU6_9CAUL|nr:sugar transferase [Caulobacter endophyticus]PVM88514.1 exopolysaccharide biosynthesis protein [Caulobacter endophyticus]